MRVTLFFSATLLCTAAGANAGPVSGTFRCPQGLSGAQSQTLDAGARKGDRRAAYCLSVRLPSLDGGELEDALTALGQYGDVRPVELLMLSRQGTLSKHSLADAIGMLPLSLTDDLQGQLTAMKRRQDQYRKITQPGLTTERQFALRSIESALGEIRNHVPSR